MNGELGGPASVITVTVNNVRMLSETLGEHSPSFATVKNWVAQFKRGDFSTCDAPCPGRPKR